MTGERVKRRLAAVLAAASLDTAIAALRAAFDGMDNNPLDSPLIPRVKKGPRVALHHAWLPGAVYVLSVAADAERASVAEAFHR